MKNRPKEINTTEDLYNFTKNNREYILKLLGKKPLGKDIVD